MSFFQIQKSTFHELVFSFLIVSGRTVMATNVTAVQESGAAGDGVINLGKCLNKTKYRSVYE